MTTVLPQRGVVRAAFPQGVALVRDLVGLGFSERTVYKRCLDGGPWQRILPGVVVLFTGRPTRDQQVLAALLLCGPDAVVTGIEACRRHRLRRGLPRTARETGTYGEVHVLVPDHRQVRCTDFVKVERTSRLPERVVRDGVPLAPLVRACMDAVRHMRERGEIAELLADAVQRGLCTPAALADELAAGSRRGTARPRQVLEGIRDGVRSAAEQDARRLWRRTGLPQPMRNVRIHDARGRFLGIADNWLDDVAMLWEIESTDWHLSPAEHERTVERAAAFVAAGAVYTATKPHTISTDPAKVVWTLRETYEQATRRPRPPLTARPADDR